jgi:hypothetical protein
LLFAAGDILFAASSFWAQAWLRLWHNTIDCIHSAPAGVPAISRGFEAHQL